MKILLIVAITALLTLWLSTERPLTFVLEPHNDVVSEGSTYTLRSQANQPCQYQWFKDGELLPGATNSSFTIPYMLEGDSGTYQVVASSLDRYTSSRTVVVTYNPTIRVVVENDMVTLDAYGPIRYTLDGTEPTSFSSLYITPLLITKPCVLRAIVGNIEMEYVRFVLDKSDEVPTNEQ